MNRASKCAGVLFILGTVSFILSVVASGLDYRVQEASGDVGNTPGWIVWWHFISLGIAVLGGLIYLLKLLRSIH